MPIQDAHDRADPPPKMKPPRPPQKPVKVVKKKKPAVPNSAQGRGGSTWEAEKQTPAEIKRKRQAAAKLSAAQEQKERRQERARDKKQREFLERIKKGGVSFEEAKELQKRYGKDDGWFPDLPDLNDFKSAGKGFWGAWEGLNKFWLGDIYEEVEDSTKPESQRRKHSDLGLVIAGLGALPFGKPIRAGAAGVAAAKGLAKGESAAVAATRYYHGEGVLRPLSRTRMARRIMKENPGMKHGQAAKLAAKESRRPGYLAAQGIKGGIEDRVISGRYGSAPGRPWSKSTIGRTGQRGYDKASEALDKVAPGKKLSSSQRAARAQQRRNARQYARQEVEIARLEGVIAKALPRFRKSGPEAAPVKEALVAALEAPASMTPRKAVETKIADLKELAIGGWGGKDVSDGIRGQLNEQITALEKALDDDLLEGAKFTEALDAMTALSREAEDIYTRVFPDATDEMLELRRNLVSRRWADRGLLPEDMASDARGYFPHKGKFEEAGNAAGVQPTAFAASQPTVGVPQRTQSAFNTQKNELLNYEKGFVNTEPRTLSNTVRARQRYENTVEARQYLWEYGDPIAAGANMDELLKQRMVFVRNPAQAPEKIPDAVRQSLDDPEKYADWAKDWIGIGEVPAWAHDLENVRVIPESVARTLLRDAFSTGPRSTVASLAGIVFGALPRMALIYTPDFGARYVVRNNVQNVLALALTNPAAFRKSVQGWGALGKRRPDLLGLIRSEAGSTRAQAGLPDLPNQAKNWAQVAEKKVTDISRTIADELSQWGDDPWRVSGWLSYADSYGFTTDEQLELLLKSSDPAIVNVRDNISQYVRDDLIDFDALPSHMRNTLSRWVFIAPFMYGATKWPLMFAREYPARAALLALVEGKRYQNMTEDSNGPVSAREFGRAEVDGREFGFGWALPHMPSLENAQAGLEFGREADSLGKTVGNLFGFLSPPLREIGSGEYAKWEDLLKSMVPGYSNQQRIRRGGSVVEILERELGTSVEVPEYRVKERDAKREKLYGQLQVAGEEVTDELRRSFRADEDYKDAEARAEFAAADLGRELTYKEKATILVEIMAEYGFSGLPTADQIAAAPKDYDWKSYLDRIKRNVRRPMDRLGRAARAAQEDN